LSVLVPLIDTFDTLCLRKDRGFQFCAIHHKVWEPVYSA
jgi:hypothetical protein